MKNILELGPVLHEILQVSKSLFCDVQVTGFWIWIAASTRPNQILSWSLTSLTGAEKLKFLINEKD
jgi:hypothetical protein